MSDPWDPLRRLGWRTGRIRAAMAAGTATLAIGTGVLLGGCGASTPRVIDNVSVERGIAESILTEHHVLSRVACPLGVKEQAGGTFTCTALFQVGQYSVPVRQTDGSGHVRWDTQEPIRLLDISRVKSAIVRSIASQRHVRAVVSCPAQVLQQSGLKFDCRASTRGSKAVHAGRYTFAVTQINDAGNVTFVGL